jgi:hypothetical protein
MLAVTKIATNQNTASVVIALDVVGWGLDISVGIS